MEYVCTGATLKCTMGTSCPKLKATPKNVTLTGKDQANIADYVSMKNIPSFGRCRSLGYPPTASATAANHGKLTPMPCVPGTCPKWKAIDKDSLICGKPALLKPATLKCMYGGTISIVDPGQTLEIKVRAVSPQTKNENKQKVEREIPEELDSNFNVNEVLDGIQLALDAAGMFPGLGAIPDLLNASIYALRGDWVSAGMSMVAAVPGIGDIVGGAKLAYKGMAAAKAIEKSRKLALVNKAKKYIGKDISKEELLSKGICKSNKEVDYFNKSLRNQRKEVAVNFYKENGMTNEKQILEHVNGIDLNKPVRIKKIPPVGENISIYRYMERAKDGSVKSGPYFTDNIGNIPDELGIADTYGKKGSLVKEKFQFVLKQPSVECLESTAAPIKVPKDGNWKSWNPLNWKHASGGKTQLYIPLEIQKRKRLLRTATKVVL